MSSILPKNELKDVNFCPSLLGQKFFVRFLGDLKKPKSPFEINLTLQFTYNKSEELSEIKPPLKIEAWNSIVL